MNTLSPQDSVGYYLPVSISDYNVNYRGFDHIELQYKLSTQSDDGWVNLCSYYADSALYAAASGNKAMIQGGSINPMETQNLIFTVNEDLPVGVYSEIIYLTDENDLSEPLKVLIEVRAVCPWENVSPQQFDRQMSLLGQVVVDGVIDTDPNDIVVAIANGQVVGFQRISYDNDAYPGYLFMTIYGNDDTRFHSLHFYLWQASTGRIFGLTASPSVTFQTGGAVGMPPADPVILSTSANEVQNFDILEGWNWISFNIDPRDDGALDELFFSTTPFSEGNQLKSAATQQFAEWDGDHWVGTLSHVDYHQMYMFYSHRDHLGTQVSGRRLTNSSERTITLQHGWNSFP